MNDAGGRVRAAGRGEGIDDEVNLTEVGADGVEGSSARETSGR